MSFLTAVPEELAAAAAKLQSFGSGLAAQNAAAATPTSGVVPAAADQVSALQAALFSAQGTLYQQISAQATAIHEMLVHTLNTNAGSYSATEALNQVSAATASLTGSGSAAGGWSPGSIWNAFTGWLGQTGDFGLSGNSANMASYEIGNWASAMSDVIGLGGGGLLDFPEAAAVSDVVPASSLDATVLAGAVGPAGSAGFGTAAMSAGMGQASAVGGMSVPPSWAAGAAVPASSTTPATLTGAGWTSAAPHSTPVTTVPAGMPAAASAGRGVGGFGTPRYGVKPTVMPKPAVV